MKTIRQKLLVLLGLMCALAILGLVAMQYLHGEKEGIVVGGKGTEGEILSEIIAQHIENELEIPVTRKCRIDGTHVLFEALKTKQIDLYVEYSGTILTAILGKPFQKKPLEKELEEIEHGLAKWDIARLSPLGFQNRYAIMMNEEAAKKLQIQTLTDLSRNGDGLSVHFDQEFCSREEFNILKNGYNISLNQLKMMDHVLLYLTLNQRGCDVINGYSTDSFASQLKILDDDLDLFPSYVALPIIRKDALKKYDGIQEIIEMLSGKISNAKMQQMNHEVEKKGEIVYDVARKFLESCSFE